MLLGSTVRRVERIEVWLDTCGVGGPLSSRLLILRGGQVSRVVTRSATWDIRRQPDLEDR